jgi:AcrR family transcriptional regulator
VRRRAILDAAVEVFGSKGFNGGTLQDVADRVGMTHAGVLHHFGSKIQLLAEVLQSREDFLAPVPSRGGVRHGLGPLRHLADTVTVHEQHPDVVRARVVLAAESVTEEHPARQFFAERFTSLRAEARRALEDLRAQDEAASEEAIAHAAASMIAVVEGLQLQWLLAPESVDLGRVTRFALDAIASAALHDTCRL